MSQIRYEGPTTIEINNLNIDENSHVLRAVTNITSGDLNLTMNYNTSYHQVFANPSSGASTVTLGTAAEYGFGVSGVAYVPGSARVFVTTYDIFGQGTETEVTSSVTQGTGANINQFSGFTGLVSGDRVRATFYTYDSAHSYNFAIGANSTVQLNIALNEEDHFTVPTGLWVTLEEYIPFRPGNK